LILGLEAGLPSPKFPMPKCACGADAKFASDQKGTTLYFCLDHTPPDILAMIENSPVYAGRNPFA
jgi:hypothetical protein